MNNLRCFLKLSAKFNSIQINKMSALIQKLNLITGKSDWVVQNENYDYHQEVARASFADMLHDTERNEMYEQAIKAAIEHMHERGKPANVLDIGTGTGLLSMMAVRHGADTVIACEAFAPMAECAKQVIKANGCEGKIVIIAKRSTDLSVGGASGDLAFKANILVTEVFDTELIGEGALSTFKHAHSVLLERDCIVVPHSATIYAQIVESPLIKDWNRVKNIYDEDGALLLTMPDSVRTCKGAANVHDVQLSQFPSQYFNTIATPQAVFKFDFSGKTPFIYNRSITLTNRANCAGNAQAVFMWWDLHMDINNKLTLSCAPSWEHALTKHANKPNVTANNSNISANQANATAHKPNISANQANITAHKPNITANGANSTAIKPNITVNKIPWRDHWMQAVYYFPQEIDVIKDEEIHLMCTHDEYSLWFNLKKDLKLTQNDYECPSCDCGLHLAYSRTRIGQLNDNSRVKKYIKILENNVNSNAIVLILSHGFYLGLIASKLGAKKVICYEPNTLSRRFLQQIIETNALTNIELIENSNIQLDVANKINLVIGEPYFIGSILPWDNLHLLYLLNEFKPNLSENLKIFPQKAVIKAVAVQFDDLHKIRAPLNACQGFKMAPFDKLMENSSQICDENVEPQPLWEYPGKALTLAQNIATIEVKLDAGNVDRFGAFEIDESIGNCNGIALWVDWVLDGDNSGKNAVSTGPKIPIEVGQNISWDIHSRQGVCLLGNTFNKISIVKYSFIYNYDDGLISFKIVK